MGKLSCKISQFCNVGNDVVMNVKFFGYGLFPYINGNGILGDGQAEISLTMKTDEWKKMLGQIEMGDTDDGKKE